MADDAGHALAEDDQRIDGDRGDEGRAEGRRRVAVAGVGMAGVVVVSVVVVTGQSFTLYAVMAGLVPAIHAGTWRRYRA